MEDYLENDTKKNNFERSTVNAAQSIGYPTLEIMKKDADVLMAVSESTILMATTCELFIQDLTLCSSLKAQKNH
uniref:Transcription factor CBF/NF-Y/archaeal histone domain-containing protein n=1 Tax=Solanum lycopersicum TaxID=4081 RepID=A0A3Q7FHW1_SOLLC